MRLLVCLFAAVALAGCSSSTSDAPPIPVEKFSELYADLLVLSAQDSSSRLADAPTGATADSVLARAGVTREAYEHTVRWYNEDVTRWRDLLERVVTRLEKRAARADSLLNGRNERAKSGQAGDAPAGQPPR
jgi:hypothetical protein